MAMERFGLRLNNFRQVATDNVGAKAFLDSDNNFYIQEAGSSLKKEVTDYGALATLEFSEKFDDTVLTYKVIAVEAFTQGNNTFYKTLVSELSEFEGDSSTSYYTVNVDKDFNLDWSTVKWYDKKSQLKSIEEQFNLDLDQDGEIYTANQLFNTLKDVTTDTAGANLRIDTEGGLWVKDGDNTFAITYSDGSIYSPNIIQTDDQLGVTYSVTHLQFRNLAIATK